MNADKSLPYVTKAEIITRLQYYYGNLPIGLHAEPKAKHLVLDPETGREYPNEHWFGVGPVAWGRKGPPALFDIRLPDTDDSYHRVNAMVREA